MKKKEKESMKEKRKKVLDKYKCIITACPLNAAACFKLFKKIVLHFFKQKTKNYI